MWSPEHLSNSDIEYAKNFERIASGLGVVVEKSFAIAQQEHTFLFAFMVKNFGIKRASRGLVARVSGDPFAPDQCGEIWDIAFENGYVPWNQAPGAIDCEPKEVIEWFNCFLWFGPESERPTWYTGEYYGERWNENENPAV